MFYSSCDVSINGCRLHDVLLGTEDELIDDNDDDDDDVDVDDYDDDDEGVQHHRLRQQESVRRAVGSSTFSVTRSVSVTSLTDAHITPSLSGLITSFSV